MSKKSEHFKNSHSMANIINVLKKIHTVIKGKKKTYICNTKPFLHFPLQCDSKIFGHKLITLYLGKIISTLKITVYIAQYSGWSQKKRLEDLFFNRDRESVHSPNCQRFISLSNEFKVIPHIL